MVIKGYVKDYYTGESLSNIGLIIEHCEYRLLAASNCNIIDTIYSDNNGSFQFDLTSYYSKKLFIDDTYFQMSVIISKNYANSEVQKIDYNGSNMLEFKVKPFRTLIISLIDSSFTYNKVDIFIAELDYEGYNFYRQEKTIINPDDSVDIIFQIKPETKHNINWSFFISENYQGYKSTQRYFENIDTSHFKIKY